jgi:L-histidine N-alpha-methyltransferase
MSEAAALEDFRYAVLTGLAQRQKTIPARFLYDRRGSELFEAITDLPEYYPTRTEIGLLNTHAAEIAVEAGRVDTLVEFGSGSSTKTPLLMEPVAPGAYVPIDISPTILAAAADMIRARFPAVQVRPVVADFTRPLALADAGRAMGFFPGSTIGNLTPAAAVDLLRAFRATLGPDSALVIGVDLRKDAAVLESAYDDAGGVTAAFNLNLIERINRELGGDLEASAFRHRARWDDFNGRIEMHLQALRPLAFHVSGHAFALAEGETIHTENSHKFFMEELRFMARAGGWEPWRKWTDGRDWFSLHLWRAGTNELQP